MITLIILALKDTLKCASVSKNLVEALLEFDFKIKPERQSLMRYCFSPLASWPVLLTLIVFTFNPFRYYFSMTQFLGTEHFISLVLFGANGTGLFVFMFFLFAVCYFLPLTTFSVLAIAFLLGQGDVFIVVALMLLSLLMAIRPLKNLKFSRSLQAPVRRLWFAGSLLSFSSWALVTFSSFEIYTSLKGAGYFAGTMFQNRLEFFTLVYFGYAITEHLILGFWGHFTYLRLSQNSQIEAQFSSAALLKTGLVSKSLKLSLKDFIKNRKATQPLYAENDLDLLPNRIVEIHRLQEKFLQEAETSLR